ncbi:conjugal transfer protein [Lactococcus lactis subsp. hordniae]
MLLGYNQKWSNRIFIGLIAGVVLLSVGSGVSYLQAKNHVHSEANKIVQSDKEKIQKMSNGQSSQDYKAQIFLNDFVKSYFNVPSNGKEQENYQKVLLAFYGQDLPVASQGQQKNPSDLESYELMGITNSTATYLVTYTTHTKEDVPASKGKKHLLKLSHTLIVHCSKFPMERLKENIMFHHFLLLKMLPV